MILKQRSQCAKRDYSFFMQSKTVKENGFTCLLCRAICLPLRCNALSWPVGLTHAWSRKIRFTTKCIHAIVKCADSYFLPQNTHATLTKVSHKSASATPYKVWMFCSYHPYCFSRLTPVATDNFLSLWLKSGLLLKNIINSVTSCLVSPQHKG